MTETDDRELERLDYEQTAQLVRALTEVRFKLLAFVPTISGAAVAFTSEPDNPGALLALGWRTADRGGRSRTVAWREHRPRERKREPGRGRLLRVMRA